MKSSHDRRQTTENYLTDALGSTIALAGSTAKIQTKYNYDPFGTTKLTGTTGENINQFAGRENDGDGLYYNRARYYNPADTRFISQDPYGQVANGPDLYLYTEDSPMNATDPYGTQSLASLPGPGNATFPAPGGPSPGGSGGSGGGGGAGGGAGAAGAGGGGFSPGGPGPGPGGAGGPGGSSGKGGYKRQTLEEENEQEKQEENETEGDKLDNHIQTFCDLSGPAGLMVSRSSPWVGGAAAAGCAGFTVGNFIFRPILEL
jgi:RHS repeat-associated protein